MPKASPYLSNFTAGIFSPRLEGRVDLAKYFNACRLLENFIVMPHGGASKRPGSYFIAETKSSGKVRLVEFAFSTEQAYVLEFGDLYIRFYMNKGQITSGASAYEIATTYTEEELFELQFEQSADVLYIAHPHHAPAKLSRTGHSSWTLSDIEFSSAAAVNVTNCTNSSGLIRVTAATHGLVSGDITRIAGVAGTTEANGTWPITRIDADNFDLRGSAYVHGYTSGGTSTKAGPFLFARISGCADNGSGLVRVTAVGHGFSTGQTVVVSGVTGTTEANGSWTVTKISDDTFDLQGSTFTNVYVSGGVASNMYPSCVAFFEQRLSWAATLNNPQTIWMSASGDYTNMETGSNDDDALIYSIVSRGVNRIRWMVPEDYLMIGTAGAEWRFGGASKTDPITPTSVVAKRQSTYGSQNVQALLVNDCVLFLQRGGRKIRELAYSFEKDSYVAPDMTILAEHVTEGGVVQMAYQQAPDSILWAVIGDGVLLGMTYQRDQNVVGWHPHVMGGSFGDGDAVVESVAVITSESGEDEVWLAVKRTIGGSTKRYVECFMPRDFGDIDDAYFVDCGLTYDGGDAVTDISGATQADPVVVSHTGHHGFTDGQRVKITGVEGMTELNSNVYTVANKTDHTYELSGIDGTGFTAYTSGGQAQVVANTISGLDHLEGETVSVFADGAVIADKTVSSGSITLGAGVYKNKVHVGLPYSATLSPMRLEAGSVDGTSQGKTKRISKLAVRFYETVSCKWGPDVDSLKAVPFGSGADPTLYSGDKDSEFDANYETDGYIVIVSDQPVPCTVLSIMPRVRTYG